MPNPGTLEIYSTNYPYATVSAGGTDTSSTTWVVGTALPFPQANYTGTPPVIFHVADPANPSETIEVDYNNSNGTWTVVRGAENTNAIAHAAGFTIKQVVTAQDGYGSFYQTAALGPTAASRITIGSSTALTPISSVYVNSFGTLPGGAGTGVVYEMLAMGSFTTSSETASSTATIEAYWGGTGGTLLGSLITGTNATALVGGSGTVKSISIEGLVCFLNATQAITKLRALWQGNTAPLTGVPIAAETVSPAPVTINGTSGTAAQLCLAWKWAVATANNTISVYPVGYQVQ